MTAPSWLEAIIDIGLVSGTLEPADIEPIRGSFATRGPRKGLLLASSPPGRSDPARAAAWQGLMSAVCPQRLSIGALFGLDREYRPIFERVSRWTDSRTVMVALNRYGQRCCEFNLFDFHDRSEETAENFARRVQAGIDTCLARQAFA